MPAEVYTQGTQYFAILFMLPVICFLTGEVYIPVFHSFQLESSYQYLELRFNHLVIIFILGFIFMHYSCRYELFVVDSMLLQWFLTLQLLSTPRPWLWNRCTFLLAYIFVTVYIFQIVGLNVDISCATMFVVCVFYTSLGGIRAVVWTDCFQVQRIKDLVITSCSSFFSYFSCSSPPSPS